MTSTTSSDPRGDSAATSSAHGVLRRYAALAARATSPAAVLDRDGRIVACSDSFATSGATLGGDAGRALSGALAGAPHTCELLVGAHRIHGTLVPLLDGDTVVGAFGSWPAGAGSPSAAGPAGKSAAQGVDLSGMEGEGERLARVGSWARRLPDGVATWSAEAFRIFGLEPAEGVPHETFLASVHPDDRERLRAAMPRLHESRVPLDEEFRIIRPDGDVRTLHARTMIERDAAGVPQRMVGFVQDVTEQHRTLEALRESDRRLSMVFEGATELMFLLRVEGDDFRYEAVNPALLHRTGLTEAQVVGRRPAEVLTPESFRRWKGWADAAMRDRVPQRYEASLTFPAGVAEVETTLTPLTDTEGRVTHLYGVARDVSARNRAERAAVTAERQFQAVVDHSLTGICIIQDRRFTYVNPRFAEIFGRTPEALLALDSLMQVVAPESRALVEAQVSRRERRETTRLHYEFTGMRPDGTRVQVEWYGTESEYGGAPATIGTMLDITERSNAERAMRESEARFRIVAAVSQSMIFEHDPIAGTSYRSEALHSAFGYSLEDADATPGWWRSLVHPDDVAAYDATVSSAGLGPSGWAHEYRVRRRDGSYATVYERAALLRDESGAVYRIIGGVTDISERRDLEHRLVQSQKMEAVGQLAGGIAHDFNNLLTVVKCHSELLLDELAAQNPMRDDVVQIHQASVRAAALTRQLLAFSRKQLLLPRLIDLNEVISGLEPMLRRLLGEDITIRTELSVAPVRTMADAGQIEQVLVNFAVNARDAMPAGGTLSMRSFTVQLDEEFCRRNAGARQGAYCAVEVRDTGTGMDERTLARVFEPFFTTKDVGKGTGLGLSTVYGIIKQSGGYVLAESTVGAGSAFTIFLPRRDDDAVRSDAAAAATLPGGRETLLLVEDEASVRALARRMLERQGYSVVEAEDGASALEIARARGGAFALVVTDLVMPRLSGRELAERLRAEHPTMRFLFMSGYTDDDIVRRGLSRPGMAFLSKPFTMGDLLHAVRKAIDEVPSP